MSFRTSAYIRAAVILVLLTGVQAQPRVNLTPLSLCAVTGSTVKISCNYTPHYSSASERGWYLIHTSDGKERVLNKDPEFTGRFQENKWQNNCDLTLKDARVRDSGVYNFRFKTSNSDWISASSGLNLTVTDLQVKVETKTVGQKKVRVTCDSTCSLHTNFFWYRNGEQKTPAKGDSSILLDSSSPFDQGSYTCQVSESLHRSAPVCVSADSDQKSCWNVIYYQRAICALVGSSAYIRCHYTFPDHQKITKTMWFIKEQTGAEPVDVRGDEKYEGRVQNSHISQNDCSMTISDLTESDSQIYQFRFYTEEGDHTGEPGFILSVSDLKITVSDTVRGGKKLTCSTTCTLIDHDIYIWYKNGQRVSGQYSYELYIDNSAGDAGSYSCALKGHKMLRSPAVYPPNPPFIARHVSEDLVILLCNSDSNPPSSYTWYHITESDIVLVGNSSSLTLTAGEVGLFYCTAGNSFGSYSTSVLLIASSENTAVKHAASGVTVVLILMFIAVILWIRRRRGAQEDDTHFQTSDPADDTYTALNLTTISPDYDTLQHVRDSASDTYTTLNPTTTSSDYETLQHVKDSPDDTT